MNEEILHVIKIVTVVAAFTTCLFPLVKWISYKINAIDSPNWRKVHKGQKPLLGGLMMFFGFLLGYMLFGDQSTIMIAILISSFILILMGIIDDIAKLDALKQLVGQIVAALIIVLYGGLLLDNVHIGDTMLSFGLFAYPITIVFIVAVINSVNLIDGLDGLAGGISAIFFLTVGVIAFLTNSIHSLEVIIAFIMLGAIIGFLIFNFNPAKIFMGGTGTLFLGFMIAVVCLLGFKTVMLASLVVPLMLLAIPIFDTLCAIIRRTIQKKPIYEADKSHLHHQLLKKFSQKKSVIVIYIVNILFSIATITYFIIDKKKGLIVYGVILLLVLIIILKTDILIDRSKKIKKKVSK